jgi:hypothetical protein
MVQQPAKKSTVVRKAAQKQATMKQKDIPIELQNTRAQKKQNT